MEEKTGEQVQWWRRKLDDILLAVVALVAKLLFIFYSTLGNVLLLLAIGVWAGSIAVFVLWTKRMPGCWWWPVWLVAPSAVYAGFRTVQRIVQEKDNPLREYEDNLRGRMEKCNDGLIAWVGKIKYYCSPMSVVEDPGSYRLSGAEIRDLIDDTLRPGDILLRGYDGYVDGIAIRNTGGGTGAAGFFSHAALYVGELRDPGDKEIAARRLEKMDRRTGQWSEASPEEKKALRNNPDYYQDGRQMVIHSMTRGVFVEDILTFTRCDYLAVLRLPEVIKLSPEDLKHDRSLIKELPEDAEAIHAALMRGESVKSADVFAIARLSALGKIGSCYDFQFNDIKTANRFSCSEFVYYCYKSIHCYLGLEPQVHGLFKNMLFRRLTISPADIYNAAVNEKKLQVVWTSCSLKKGGAVKRTP